MAGLGIFFFLFGLVIEHFLCSKYSSISIKMKKVGYFCHWKFFRSVWMTIRYDLQERHIQKTWLMYPRTFLSSLNSVLWSSSSKHRVVMCHIERIGVSPGPPPQSVLNQQLLWRWHLWKLNRRWNGWENIHRKLGAVQQSKSQLMRLRTVWSRNSAICTGVQNAYMYVEVFAYPTPSQGDIFCFLYCFSF